MHDLSKNNSYRSVVFFLSHESMFEVDTTANKNELHKPLIYYYYFYYYYYYYYYYYRVLYTSNQHFEQSSNNLPIKFVTQFINVKGCLIINFYIKMITEI